MKNILFICTGNTCRSPMAEALLKHKGKDRFEVKSAGVFALDGSRASYQTVEVLKEQGILHDHASQPLSKELIEWADLILTMTENHRRQIGDNYPQALDKTFTLKEFAGAKGNLDVTDPFGGSVDVYRATFNELEQWIDRLLEKLK